MPGFSLRVIPDSWRDRSHGRLRLEGDEDAYEVDKNVGWLAPSGSSLTDTLGPLMSP